MVLDICTMKFNIQARLKPAALCIFLVAVPLCSLACDAAGTLRDMNDASPGNRIRGVKCIASLSAPSVDIIKRLAVLFGDQSRGPSRGAGLLDGLFPGQREYSEQVDFHANEAAHLIPLNPQYLDAIFEVARTSTSDTAKQVETSLLKRFAYGGYRAEVVQGLNRIIRREPNSADGFKPYGGGLSVKIGDENSNTLDGIDQSSYKLKFLLDEVGSDTRYSQQLLSRFMSDDSVVGIASASNATGNQRTDRVLVPAQAMQAALTALEASGNFLYVSEIALALKQNFVSSAMAVPVLQRMSKENFETPDQFIKWTTDKRNFNQMQKAKFKGEHGEDAYKKWLAKPANRSADEAAALLATRNTLLQQGQDLLIGTKETYPDIEATKKQSTTAALADTGFMASPRATSFTVLAQSQNADLALLAREGNTTSEWGRGVYKGNTRCTQRLPVACTSIQTPLGNQTYWDADNVAPTVRLTAPVLGSSMVTFDAGDAVCVAQFGSDWKMLAEPYGQFTNAVAMVQTNMASTARFWVKPSGRNIPPSFCNMWNAGGTLVASPK